MTPPPAARGTGRATRREAVDRQHRATRTVLVVGSVLALAAAAGPLWLVRAGLVIAVATTLLTAVLAGRELAAARRRHAHRLLVLDRRHGDALRAERTRNAEVVETLGDRLRSSGAVVAGQRGTIARLQGELQVVGADRDDLREQVAERDGLIGLFRSSLREQEAALLAVRDAERAAEAERARAAEAGAEVHSLPRRSRPADDRTHAPAMDATMTDLAMVLPNYEGSRRVG